MANNHICSLGCNCNS